MFILYVVHETFTSKNRQKLVTTMVLYFSLNPTYNCIITINYTAPISSRRVYFYVKIVPNYRKERMFYYKNVVILLDGKYFEVVI